jgi:hypothetical protein
MAVLHPLNVIIDNYPDDLVENWMQKITRKIPHLGNKKIPFSKVYILNRRFP